MQNKGKTLKKKKKSGLSQYCYENIKTCHFSSTCISLHSHANPTALSIHISCCKKLMKYYGGWMHAHMHVHTNNHVCAQENAHMHTDKKGM
jgi:hypothetical protein